MVQQCFICKKTDYIHQNLSYHRFPKNIERRNIWLKRLGFSQEQIPKLARICSDHFNENDFIIKTSRGAKFLKRDANPIQQLSGDETEVIDCDREDFLENLDELESNSCKDNFEAKLFTGNLKPNKVLALFPTKEPSGEPHFVCTYIPVYELTSLDNKDVYRPDINAKEEIKLPVFNINVKEETETSLSNIIIKEEIETYADNINVKEELEICVPNINLKEETETLVSNISIKEEIDIYFPDIKEECA